MVFHRDKNAFSKNISTRCDAMNFSSHEIKKKLHHVIMLRKEKNMIKCNFAIKLLIYLFTFIIISGIPLR